MAKRNTITYSPPPDKSITHRAFFFASLARGQSVIENPLLSEDTLATLKFIESIGAKTEIRKDSSGTSVVIKGTDGKPSTPEDFIYCANSGTTVRLGMGIATWVKGEIFLTGDSSLRKRPMDRVLIPLSQRGVEYMARHSKYLPVAMKTYRPVPLKQKISVASAQVKSALLFASLASGGENEVEEPGLSRDHTENFIEFLLGKGTIERTYQGKSHTVRLNLPHEKASWKGFHVEIPGDPSSAAFLIFAAIFKGLRKGKSGESEKFVVENIMLNPTRSHYIKILQQTGAPIRIKKETRPFTEKTGTLELEPADQTLSSPEIHPEDIPLLIDELPLFGAFGFLFDRGIEIRNAKELRIKESDRIKAVVENLKALKVRVEEYEDGFKVHPKSPDELPKEVLLNGFNDHRIVMAFSAVCKSLGIKVSFINDKTPDGRNSVVSISYPEFFKDLDLLD